MCTFTFTYTDGKILDCEHIESAAYTSGNRVDIPGQDLATHMFPLHKDLWLFTESGSFCISSDGLRSIEVTTE